MKFDTCALLTTAIFAAFPHAAVAGTSYDCKVDATYKVEDDDTNPMMPTEAQKDWAAARVKSSYQAVHDYSGGGDFDMTENDWNSFTLTPARFEKKEEVYPLGKLGLRGGSKVGDWTIYDGKLYNGPKIWCDLCGNWDDDDGLAQVEAVEEASTGEGTPVKTGVGIAEKLSATETHYRWEEAWCDEMSSGPYEVFEYIYDCKLHLYDCTVSASEAGEAVEEIAVNMD